MEQNLLEKTGKTLQQWQALLADKGFEKHGDYMRFLKQEAGLTHGYANFIALKCRAADAASHSESDLVENQYRGKESLKPLYDKLLDVISGFGDDIDIAPKKASVSLRVKRQFALIQPSTKTRIDVGLKFNDKPHTERLETSGPFGTMCTHRVRLTASDQIDDELIGWLKEAYTQAH